VECHVAGKRLSTQSASEVPLAIRVRATLLSIGPMRGVGLSPQTRAAVTEMMARIRAAALRRMSAPARGHRGSPAAPAIDLQLLAGTVRRARGECRRLGALPEN